MSKPVFVLVHGAWHSANCWSYLIPLLEDLGHEALAPDLPGHGADYADPARTNLKVYSEYISELIDNIEDKVILMGHSMSGMVISQAAEMQPDKIARLAYLSAYLPGNGQSLFDLIAENRGTGPETAIEQAMQMSPDKRTCTIRPEAIAPLFYSLCPPERLSAIPLEFPAEASLPFAGKVTLTENRFGRVPLTYICCLRDLVIPIAHQRAMLKRQPCDEMIQLDADHSPFYSCPGTLASVLHAVSLGQTGEGIIPR